METAGYRGRSRRQEPKGKIKKRKVSHFRTVRFGGFDENQIICYLWDIVKSVEAAQDAGISHEAGTGRDAETLTRLGKQMRSQIRVEIRRYFVRRRRRNVRMALGVVAVIVCIAVVFGCLIGVDRVSGNSMYPYLNHGDWIVYSRIGEKYQRNEVIVFEKNGESMVKRIAGLPGDRVEVNSSGSRVVVNGQEIQEDYVTLSDADVGNKKASTEKVEEHPGMTQTVMNGQYLVLGDNRSVSIDSRDSSIGTVPSGEIQGRVILIIRGNGG
ncbi:signal peptidase I [Hungatella hathewayi]|uniref:signal peptidase I n=1 Tax=Hungatella hathewayi TaxID=154046 RepID=UPI0002E8FAA7|nr:signal peptidase I [Hungatella hathewayi]